MVPILATGGGGKKAINALNAATFDFNSLQIAVADNDRVLV